MRAQRYAGKVEIVEWRERIIGRGLGCYLRGRINLIDDIRLTISDFRFFRDIRRRICPGKI